MQARNAHRLTLPQFMTTCEHVAVTNAANGRHDSDARKVLIVKSNLERFRLPFYSGLEKRLAQENVQLRVAVPVNRCGSCTASWLVPVRGGNIQIAGKTLSWQRVLGYARGSQLVIAQQCAQELTNYYLLALRKTCGYRLALWGHGADFQRTWTTPVTHLIKRKIFDTVDFWFAYTPGVAKIVESWGFPRDRICSVFNSVDTTTEANFHRSVTDKSKVALRAAFGMMPGAKLVSYCGALYKAKRLDFLVNACKVVRNAGIDLHLVVIGDGAERARLERTSRDEKWIHVAGAASGERKALYLAASECMAIPGVVGLAVVDAFAHECPLITTSARGHGPEIEYLEDGINGIKTADNIDPFAESLVRVVTDEQLKLRLRQGCRDAAALITMENMIERFAIGVMKALRVPLRRS